MTHAPRIQWTMLPKYVLRYGALKWAVLAVALLELLPVFQRGMQWRGDLLWTLDWLPVAFVAIGPVVAGFSAIDTGNLSRGAEGPAQGRPWKTPAFGVWLAYSVVVGTLHVVAALAMLVISMPVMSDWSWPLALVIQVLGLSLCCAIGSLAGRFSRPLLAGLIAALAVFALVYLTGAKSDHVNALYMGVTTVPRVGYRYNVGYLVVQAGMLVAMIVAALVPRPSPHGYLLRVRPSDVGISAIVVGLSLVAGWSVTAPRLVHSETLPTDCQMIESVPVCYYAEHRRVQAAFNQGLAGLFKAARSAAYEELIPPRVEEASRTRLPQSSESGVGSLYVSAESLGGQIPDLTEIALGLVEPVHCHQLAGGLPPSERYGSDLWSLVGTWVDLAQPGRWAEFGLSGEPMTSSEAEGLVRDFRSCHYSHFTQ